MTPPPAGTSVVVDTVTLNTGDSPSLELGGIGEPPVTLSLVGSRSRIPATVETSGQRWHATIPLLVSRWGAPAMAPPSGRYRFEPSLRTATSLPEAQLLPRLFRIALDTAESAIAVVFSAPLTDAENGKERQAELEAHYRATAYPPENAVYFESFYGQTASCNPLALDRALAMTRPDIPRYWGVRDASVSVPEGSIPVLEGSEEWWRVRGAVRLIVINDWLRNRYRKRRHQKVLQTWHGTMLKKLALSRAGVRLRPALATLRERARWDILLSQNRYATRIFRRAYLYAGPVWEEGYPRDDSLLVGSAAAVRAKLGIADDATVLLYAPTWRDDRPDRVDHLDVSNFTKRLNFTEQLDDTAQPNLAEQLNPTGQPGGNYVTLIRGHSRTLQPGTDLYAGGVIDVTSYPDVSELFLIADALITDYSSVMFDFSVTGKPIFFFTPDLDRYREVLRGFYFDLMAVAPGPVVRDPDELIDLVRNLDGANDRYAQKYAAWRERFNPRDDGRAAERVIARVLREGLLE